MCVGGWLHIEDYFSGGSSSLEGVLSERCNSEIVILMGKTYFLSLPVHA